MTEQQLERELHDLAGRIHVPPSGVAADLDRGRRRRRRRHAVQAGGAGVAAAVVLGAALVVPGGPGQRSIGPVERPTSSPSPSPTSGETALPLVDGRAPAFPDPYATPDHAQVLGPWGDVLAERLDPTGQHLGGWDGYGMHGGNASLGYDYPWTNPGEPGQGEIALVVGASWEDVDWFCEDCRAVAPPAGVVRAEAWSAGEALAVAVERADGTVVHVAFDPRDANNSLVAVSGSGPTEQDLIEAAVDPRFVLPEISQPPAFAVEHELFEDAGVAELAAEGERLDVFDRGLRTRTSMSARSRRGLTTWTAFWTDQVPPTSTDCFAATYTDCRLRHTPRGDVFVARLRTGGWLVRHVGDTFTITVTHEPARATARSEDMGADPVVERAAEFVVSPRWQRPVQPWER